jgi:hypothetical protein
VGLSGCSRQPRALSVPRECPASRARSNRLVPAELIVFPFDSSLRLSTTLDTGLALSFAGPAKLSHRCDVIVVPRPSSTNRRCESERPVWIVLSVSHKNEFGSFHFSPPFRPLHWARLRGNSCALQLRVFCFSVSSQKLFANDSEDFLCPSRNADARLGSRPLSLPSAPITRAEKGA